MPKPNKPFKSPSLSTTDNVRHIFVYGTLRNRAKAAERRLLTEHGVHLGVGQVRSASLFLGDYPYAVPDKGADRALIGDVYQLDLAALPEVLRKLDAYEEYDPNDVKNSLYRREVVRVLMGKRIISAWIYWYNGSLGNSPMLRSGNYLKIQMHVVPSGSGWQVKVAGISEAAATMPTKVDAVKRARKLAGRSRMMLVIHGRNGRIQERIPAEEV